MNKRESYRPGHAAGAEVIPEGDFWTLVITRELRHSPDRVWQALTNPDQLRQWAPFDADSSLGSQGARASLSTVGSPNPHVTPTEVTVADRPRLLVYKWGDSDMRWELEEKEHGTCLKLWTKINNKYVAMGATGWHVCLDVLESLMTGEPIGRIAGGDAMAFPGWHQLFVEYSRDFGVEIPKWAQKGGSQ